jgi:hypothetical protein
MQRYQSMVSGCAGSLMRTGLNNREFSRFSGLKMGFEGQFISINPCVTSEIRHGNNREFCGLIRASCSLSRDRSVHIRDGDGAQFTKLGIAAAS